MTVAAAAFAYACFLGGYPTAIYDSFGYHILSDWLFQKGLLSWPTDLRTYGYPFFLAVIRGFRALPPEETRLAAFLVQLGLYLGGCLFVSRRLARIFRSEAAGLWAYAAGACNPVLLLHTTELLSDLLSAVLIQLAVALCWKLPDEDPAPRIGPAFASFLCAAFSVVVRPANVVVLPALAAAWLLRALRWRAWSWPAVGAALAGLIPPFLPQLIINYGISGKLNPLIVASLYRQQRGWGMGSLKYGTVVIPGRSPFLTYLNPLYAGDPGPRTFLLHHPLRYLGTLALHLFALLDHDLPYTYITDLAPWYRWPLAAVNFLLLYVAAAGTVVLAARTVRRRELDERGFVLVSTLLVAAAYAVVYLPVAVESRFGIALEALMTPLLVAGVLWLACPGERSRRARARAVVVLGAPFVLLLWVALSSWLTTTQTNQFVESPANALVLDPRPARPPR